MGRQGAVQVSYYSYVVIVFHKRQNGRILFKAIRYTDSEFFLIGNVIFYHTDEYFVTIVQINNKVI